MSIRLIKINDHKFYEEKIPYYTSLVEDILNDQLAINARDLESRLNYGHLSRFKFKIVKLLQASYNISFTNAQRVPVNTATLEAIWQILVKNKYFIPKSTYEC